jgi:AcrR family transcriptional regulator
MDTRIARTRAAVLRSATDLLVEGGPSAVTIDAIVARSGVAKSTIYRHWESRDDILVAVIEHCAPDIVAPDPELGFERGLRMLMTQFRAALTDPEWARVIPALLLLKTHQEGIADLEERLGDHQDHMLERIIAIGVEEGCLPANADIEQIAAQLIGPLVFAHLTGRPPLTEEFAQHIVDGFLRSSAVVET